MTNTDLLVYTILYNKLFLITLFELHSYARIHERLNKVKFKE